MTRGRLSRAAIAAVLPLLVGCAPTPTPVIVTLTPPIPTPTIAPISLAPVMETGSHFVYADGTTLVAVPLGPFLMGHGNAALAEHTVTLSDFWIYATEVTNRQYAVCIAQDRCTPPDPADNPGFLRFDEQSRPVVGVTYEQSRAYCNFMNADLPTEAQWEKAARGTDGQPYPWGDQQPSCERLNFGDCAKHTSDATANPKGASPYGALNMAGNVGEWVADWYDPAYYRSSPPGDPPGPDSGRARVIRSSGFRSNADQSLAYARSFSSPEDHRSDLGFRCAVSNLDYFAPACHLTSTVSDADMGSVTADCPVIGIDVQASACRYGGGAVVTFNDDHAQDPNASFGGIVGCALISGQPGSFPLTYRCTRSSTAVMTSSCSYTGIQNPSCPERYSLEPSTDLCAWDGSRAIGTECPTGEFYDPVRHCCSVNSGKIIDFPVCPVGTLFTETAPDRYACLPVSGAREVPAQQVAVNPPVCPGACDLTVELCSLRNLVFCETTCSCLQVGVKCPTH